MTTHTAGLRLYFGVFIALMVLLIATVLAARVNFSAWHVGPIGLGWLSVAIMLTIAIVKAALVVLYFMHVRWSSKVTWVFVVAGFLWLGIMVSLTLGDYLSRGWMFNDSVFLRPPSGYDAGDLPPERPMNEGAARGTVRE